MRLKNKAETRLSQRSGATEGERIAAALILRGSDADTGRTTGYYWRRLKQEEDAQDSKSWYAAVLEGAGPLPSTEDAFAAAERGSLEEMDLARRLDEAASLIRSGHIDPTRDGLVEYLEKATEINAARRSKPDAAGRTAHGLFIQDGREAIARSIAEDERIEAEIAAQPDGEWTHPRGKWYGLLDSSAAESGKPEAASKPRAEPDAPRIDRDDPEYKARLERLVDEDEEEHLDFVIPYRAPAEQGNVNPPRRPRPRSPEPHDLHK